MSAPLVPKFSRFLFSNFLIQPSGLNFLSPLGSSVQLRWKRPPKTKYSTKRGQKKYSGEYVEAGMILHRQLGLKVYPGENVGFGRDCTLFALEAGRVFVTTEVLRPYPHSPLYPAVKGGRIVYKQFYHVLPEEQIGQFRLVSQT